MRLEVSIQSTSEISLEITTVSCASWAAEHVQRFGSRKTRSNLPSTLLFKTQSHKDIDWTVTCLKVAAATGCQVDQEAEFLKALNWPAGSHPGKSHVQRLLDEFKHTGPNGTHQILVLEPMGRTLADHLTGVSETVKRNKFVREVSRQVVLGLDYIHSRVIAHRGVFPISFLKGTINWVGLIMFVFRPSTGKHSFRSSGT
jgi:serine/threonine protein kinase